MSDQAALQSPENRLMAFLGTEEDEQNQPIAEDEPETEDAPADEAEDGEEQETDEATPEPRKLKLKRGDEEIEVDEQEAIALAQQGFDYTKKTQAVAEAKRMIEERAQAVQAQEQYLSTQHQLQQQFIRDIAQIESVQQTISQYEQINWQALSDQDPVQAQKLFFEYSRLNNQRQNMIGELQMKQQQAAEAHEAHKAQILQQGVQQLRRDFPDWTPDKAAKIKATGKEYGFTDGELAQIYDPRYVKVLADAMAYREMQKSKPTTNQKVADKPPVVKPGSKDPKAVATTQTKEMRLQLKKTGKSDFAAKLIEKML